MLRPYENTSRAPLVPLCAIKRRVSWGLILDTLSCCWSNEEREGLHTFTDTTKKKRGSPLVEHCPILPTITLAS